MDLSYLEEFIELSHSLNFTETANKLHLSQPTLSKHIATLETDLRVHLFERSHANVSITEEGFYFLGIAHSITDSYIAAVHRCAR
jgi:DNA-binding transcriptional LysR family regulator